MNGLDYLSTYRINIQIEFAIQGMDCGSSWRICLAHEFGSDKERQTIQKLNVPGGFTPSNGREQKAADRWVRRTDTGSPPPSRLILPLQLFCRFPPCHEVSREQLKLRANRSLGRYVHGMHTSKVLILVDESNLVSSVRPSGRNLDWIKLRDYLVRKTDDRRLIEMVVYVGLPPAMPEWQTERDKKNKFLFWLRSNGFMVVAKEGSPADEGHYKANVDVLMAIDAVELSVEMHPDVVVLVTGDADFAHLALQLRRRGIRIEVAAMPQNLGSALRTTANEVIDISPIFEA